MACIAAVLGQVEVFLVLVEEAVVDIEGTDYNPKGERLLFVAAARGRLTVQWLVEHGYADVLARSTLQG